MKNLWEQTIVNLSNNNICKITVESGTLSGTQYFFIILWHWAIKNFLWVRPEVLAVSIQREEAYKIANKKSVEFALLVEANRGLENICLNDQTVYNLKRYLNAFPEDASVVIHHHSKKIGYYEADCQICCNDDDQHLKGKVQLMHGMINPKETIPMEEPEIDEEERHYKNEQEEIAEYMLQPEKDFNKAELSERNYERDEKAAMRGQEPEL